MSYENIKSGLGSTDISLQNQNMIFDSFYYLSANHKEENGENQNNFFLSELRNPVCKMGGTV
ncbi:hypothetical protein GCM10007383_36570 [Arenibacter certesii]|uniref:Uncharacterized protein n=1 Tax=Arenibacter certesii TaxID=228955 RepID=A0A918MQ41_9FLAO|nr:hypothetical protein GCM10007383_36570 [Arenibacter certesii]